MNRLLTLLLLLPFSSQAQDLLHCGADELRIQTLQGNPKIAQAVIAGDTELEAFTREYAQFPNRGGQVYTIPLVFHVIHKYGNENISREQILDGIRILNETFRKTREDTADIHEDFKPIHADTEIEFALATKDPEGNCHSGINRIASDLTTVGDHQVKQLIHWDPGMYLNVYIVSNAAGLAGHCVWPADADTIPAWDGIVIAHNYVGTIGTSNLTQSVAFAHECGHYLNLHHIWGGNNVPNFYYLPVGQASNCAEDDLVDDTPNSIGWSNCNLNAASCGNVRDNVQNAMDYSYCNIMFTEGQKTRMQAALNSPIANRNNLWTPANLLATGVAPSSGLCAADFDSDKQVVCPHIDNIIGFTNTSYHGEADSLFWEFPGGFPPSSTVENPTISYSSSGLYNVSLTAYSGGSPQQVTKQNSVTVLHDSIGAVPIWEWFEGNSDLNGSPWFENSLDLDNNWTITEHASHSTSHSVWVDNWNNPRMTIDELYGPPIDLSSHSNMRLGFWYAFAGEQQASSTNRLLVQVSRNCESNWVTRLTLSGSNLETAPPQAQSFIPSADQWFQESISIPSTYLEDGFRFRFVFTSEGNNRLYLDDINVDVDAGIADETLSSLFELYPNPATEELTLTFNSERHQKIQLSIIGVDGKLITEMEEMVGSGIHRQTLSLQNLRSGIYFLKHRSDQGTITKRFIVL